MKTCNLLVGLTAVVGFVFAGTASAALVLNYQDGSGNDCSGAFGKAPNCQIAGSYLLAKFEYDEGAWVFDDDPETPENDGSYYGLDGSEFVLTATVTNDDGEPVGGTFTYNPSPGDPLIKFWSVKAGNGYRYYWYTDGVAGEESEAVALAVGVAYNWVTAGKQGISHISFYNGDEYVVPIPAAAWLLGSGLIGLLVVGRRRKKSTVAAA